MWHDDKFHCLTKHGRLRFIKRVGLMSDKAMLEAFCTGKVLGYIKTGFYFKPEDDWSRGDAVRLVTVFWSNEMRCLAPILRLMDRPSEFTFDFSEFKRRMRNEKNV